MLKLRQIYFAFATTKTDQMKEQRSWLLSDLGGNRYRMMRRCSISSSLWLLPILSERRMTLSKRYFTGYVHRVYHQVMLTKTNSVGTLDQSRRSCRAEARVPQTRLCLCPFFTSVFDHFPRVPITPHKRCRTDRPRSTSTR